MKIKLLFTLIGLAVLTLGNAQRIDSQKVFGGYKYTQNGKVLNMGGLVNAMEPESEAYDLARQARTATTVSIIFGLPAGFLIGYPLGEAIAGGDPQWSLAAIGAGLLVVSIPFSSSANKKARRAMDLYNASYGDPVPAVSVRQPVIGTGSTRHGYGLTMAF